MRTKTKCPQCNIDLEIETDVKDTLKEKCSKCKKMESEKNGKTKKNKK